MNVIEVWLSNGKLIQFSENHPVPGLGKGTQAKDIGPGDLIEGFRVDAKRVITPSLSDLKKKFAATTLV